jgi:cell division protease FtsH
VKAAEEIFIGEISTGASNDLERATDIIKSMVMIYGMSDVAGLMVLEKQTNKFLGGFAEKREYSEKMQEQIDNFVKEMLAERYQHVKNILRKYAEVIEQMVKELYEKEVIEGSRVRELIAEFDKKEGNNEENRDNS